MADFVIERCLPSDRAAEIRGLFDRTGHPEFGTVYERVYVLRQRRGLRSWIALEDNQVALHVSVTLEPFSDGTTPLTAGLLGDLMADEAHRDFWSPIKLVRRMVGDVRKDRSADFLLTSYLPVAEGVFRAAGFKPFGELRRHVLPLIWPYPLLRRLLHGEDRPRLTAVPFNEFRLDKANDLTSPGTFRPVPADEFYGTRMPRQEYPAGTWLLAGNASLPDAAVLVSPKETGELIVSDVLWRDAEPRLAGVLSAVAGWATRKKHRTVSLTTLSGSHLAVAARRAGFIRRPDPYPLVFLPITDPTAIPRPEDWTFTPFVLTAW